jgi:hypothetical protein
MGIKCYSGCIIRVAKNVTKSPAVDLGRYKKGLLWQIFRFKITTISTRTPAWGPEPVVVFEEDAVATSLVVSKTDTP